jgi:hypothetical protein
MQIKFVQKHDNCKKIIGYIRKMGKHSRKNDLIPVPEFSYKGKETDTTTCMTQDVALYNFG